MAEPLRISSRQNPRVKDAIRLRDSKLRAEEWHPPEP